MHPINPKDGLRAFMQVDPEKVRAREQAVRAKSADVKIKQGR
jgi:hypothetical protein